MRKLFLVATVALLTSVPSAVPAASSARTEPSVLAIDWRVHGRERLVAADPLTLRPRDAISVDLAGHAWPYGFTSDRSLLVLGRWQPPSLRLVDARRLRVLRDVPLGGTARVEIKAMAWLGRQIVVLVEKRQLQLTLLRVDAAAGEVVASTAIGRGAAEVVATPARLVVLLVPVGRIGSARLVVVTRDRVRTVALAGIRAGSVRASRGKPHTVVQPGLAVSPNEPRAWVIGAERSAEIDLRTLATRYRGEPRRASSRQKEPVAGTARDAEWLAPGRLVVAGWDAARGDGERTSFEWSGLRLLDTESWTDQVIHPRALLFYVHPPYLLTMAPGEADCAASTLTAYTLTGDESFRVCERRATGEIEFAGRYVRLGLLDGWVAVVSLDTGTVVERLRDVRVNPLDTALVQEP